MRRRQQSTAVGLEMEQAWKRVCGECVGWVVRVCVVMVPRVRRAREVLGTPWAARMEAGVGLGCEVVEEEDGVGREARMRASSCAKKGSLVLLMVVLSLKAMMGCLAKSLSLVEMCVDDS
jgi:hypothetical protein